MKIPTKLARECLRALLSSDDMLDHIINRPGAVVIVKNVTKDVIVWANSNTADMLGVPLSEVIGAPCSAHWGDDATKYNREDMKIIQAGSPRLGYLEGFGPHGNSQLLKTHKGSATKVVRSHDPDDTDLYIVAMCDNLMQLKEALKRSIVEGDHGEVFPEDSALAVLHDFGEIRSMLDGVLTGGE